MKTSLIVAGTVVLAGIGYYFFMMQSAPGDMPAGNGSEAKIDINAVCEGALAYMTFPSGVEAEAWVAECKNGEHPEAIEQWKVQMGITDDRAI